VDFILWDIYLSLGYLVGISPPVWDIWQGGYDLVWVITLFPRSGGASGP
jgi:hypothetical protein